MTAIEHLYQVMQTAEAIVIGAGAGLSTSAGFTYSGERFQQHFADFIRQYGFTDMYTAGFHPFVTEEEFWAYWVRYIYVNRYMDAPKDTYQKLLNLLKDKDYFVITTNVDHCFQKAGFDKKRLFYTQGDYGLFQSLNPDIRENFDNEEWVMKAMESQGFVRDENGFFTITSDSEIRMEIDSSLIPKCPVDNSDVTMNLRSDDSFLEDDGWHSASAAYSDFLRRHENMHVLFLELGVGANTPVIIKYPFWQMTMANENAIYACINYKEAYCPGEIEDRAICINSDIDEVLNKLA